MSAIMIGSARHDENGKYTGGASGDSLQKTSPDTAGEVSMQAFYLHSKGWYILRPKTAELAAKLAGAMTGACNNAAIGYDQGGRAGVITQVKAAGALAKITAKTECDCSSLVRACCIEAGFDPGDFTTANEADKLSTTDKFEVKRAYVSQSATPLYNGDVLVTKTKGHTAIVTGGNPRSTAVTTTAKEVFCTVTLRVLSKGKSGEDVRALQRLLIAAGYSCGSCGADGDFGSGTDAAVKAYQKAKGLTVDGAVGTNTWGKLLGAA